MALSALDHESALVIIDLQNGIVSLPTAHPVDAVVRHSAVLAEAFRRAALPVVLVNVAGGAPGRAEQKRGNGALPSDWTLLVGELKQHADDHLVTKNTWGAFTNTDLNDYLKSRGVTQIVLAGVATSIGVESTARQAHELGYNVALVIDAMTDLNADAHSNSVARIFPRLGETGSTQDILELLVKRGS